MTVKDFIENNKDIFGKRITAKDIIKQRVIEYKTLIMIKTAASIKDLEKPMEEREILDVSFVMPIFNGVTSVTYIKEMSDLGAVSCQIRGYELESPMADHMLFYMNPFREDDQRRRVNWQLWD